MRKGTAVNNGIEIAYETLGDPANASILLIAGLGSQLVYWTDEFCQAYLDRGFHIIRFDNRDPGLSSKTPGNPPSVAAVLNGDGGQPAYTLSDMATDTISVLDALNIEAAHLVGTSLGGMIAQTTALEHPRRVRTLTSIMSSAKIGAAVGEDLENEAAIENSLTMDLSDPSSYVELQVEGYRAASGPHFEADYIRAIIQRSFERAYHPAGWSFQMMAAQASGDRTDKLGSLSMPALVIHGDVDPLIPPAAGEATAAAIPGSNYLSIKDMGHNFPRLRWSKIADAIASIARQG